MFTIPFIEIFYYVLNKFEFYNMRKKPQIGRIIKIRRMYQHFYLIFNILLIIITLIATIFINYHLFIIFS